MKSDLYSNIKQPFGSLRQNQVLKIGHPKIGEFLDGLKRILGIVQNSVIGSCNKKTIVARPDFQIGNQGDIKIMELNIDSAVAAHGYAAISQYKFGVIKNGQAPFILAWLAFLKHVEGSVAFLATRESNGFADPADSFLVSELCKLSGRSLKYYRAEEWSRLSFVPENNIFRFLSPHQLGRHNDLQEAYQNICSRSKDLFPLDQCRKLEDKTHLATLYNLALAEMLPSQDCDFILKYIPKTIDLANFDEAENRSIKNQLKTRQFNYVIKKKWSHSARDVYIGANLDIPTWLGYLDKIFSVKPNEWIVQQNIGPARSLKMSLTNSESQVNFQKDVTVVFGAFIIGDKCPCVNGRAMLDGDFSQRIFSITDEFAI